MKPTIQLVAKKAGVSMSTVSRVMNNHPSVLPETGGIRENRDTREERDMHDLPSAFELHKTRHNRYGMRNHEHTPSSQRQDEQTA